MKALILAAGQGTRLRHLTHARPKPMLPIQGKPLLHHLIVWLRDHGIRQIAVNLHHQPAAIPQYLGDGSRLGVALHYSYEPRLYGTAGAAKQLEGFLDEDFVVVYGDVFTNLNLTRLLDWHRRGPSSRGETAAMTMSLYRAPDPTQCGVVELDARQRVTRFVEKPHPLQVFSDLAFSGIMVCGVQVLEYIPPNRMFDFGHDVIPALLAAGAPIYGLPLQAQESVIDIGTLPGYLYALRQACRLTVQADKTDSAEIDRVQSEKQPAFAARKTRRSETVA